MYLLPNPSSNAVACMQLFLFTLQLGTGETKKKTIQPETLPVLVTSSHSSAFTDRTEAQSWPGALPVVNTMYPN